MAQLDHWCTAYQFSMAYIGRWSRWWRVPIAAFTAPLVTVVFAHFQYTPVDRHHHLIGLGRPSFWVDKLWAVSWSPASLIKRSALFWSQNKTINFEKCHFAINGTGTVSVHFTVFWLLLNLSSSSTTHPAHFQWTTSNPPTPSHWLPFQVRIQCWV